MTDKAGLRRKADGGGGAGGPLLRFFDFFRLLHFWRALTTPSLPPSHFSFFGVSRTGRDVNGAHYYGGMVVAILLCAADEGVRHFVPVIAAGLGEDEAEIVVVDVFRHPVGTRGRQSQGVCPSRRVCRLWGVLHVWLHGARYDVLSFEDLRLFNLEVVPREGVVRHHTAQYAGAHCFARGGARHLSRGVPPCRHRR